MALGAFVGRVLLASLFLLSGAMKVAQHDEATGGPIVAYMAPKMDNALNQIEQLTGLHVPLEKDIYPILVLGAGCLELLGGVLFTLNVQLGAVMLLVFLIPTTIIMHNFWDLPPGSPAHQIEFINFMKNLCLAGAFLMYINMPRPHAIIAAKLKGL